MVEIRPATGADVREVLGGDLPRSARVLAITLDGRTGGLGGIYPQGAQQTLWLELAPWMRSYLLAHRREIVRLYRRLLEMASSRRLPIVAAADPTIDGADRMLAHMGFEPVGQGVWLCQAR